MMYNTKNSDVDVENKSVDLRSEVTPLYFELIDKCKKGGIEFRKAKDHTDSVAFTCVPAFVGNGYKPDSEDSVMIVGRAVNGWDVDWPTETDEIVEQVLNQSFDLESINDLPEQDGYYFSKSRFFLVIREMMKRLGATDSDWSSKFVWSNLYKVAPALNGNPKGKEQHIQRESAIRLLRKEIELFKPKYIVFVTGYDFTTWSWYNNTCENTFAKEFNIQKTDNSGDYVEGYGSCNGNKIIVACRPETKSVEAWVDSVLNAFTN